MNDLGKLLQRYDEWAKERADICERDNDGGIESPSSSEWQNSDDTAFDLLESMAFELRKFAEPNYLTVDEIAEKMRVSKMTVYRLCHSGQLPTIRVGRSFRVLETDLAGFVRQSEI